MEINKWYKQSEVGVIPQDWQVMQLKDIASYRRGSFPQPYGLSKWYDEVLGKPFIQVFDVENNQLKLKNETKKHISAIAEKMSVFAEIGSVVVTINGSVGRIALTQYEGFIDRTLLIFEEYKVPLVKKYFIYALYVLFQIEKEKAPGAILRTITKEHLSGFYLPLPPLPEQHAIAEALSDIDALIAAQEALIAKKRAIKQGVMQELLTGKRRLPGFRGEWEEKRLGCIGEFSKGKGLQKEDLDNKGNILAIPYTAIYTDFNEIIKKDQIKNFTSTSNTVIINGDHLLIAGSSNMLENIGKTCAYILLQDVAIGGDIILYKTNANISFISYLLSTKYHRKKIISLSQGSTIRHVYASTFSDYEIKLPSISEQNYIVDILSNLDAEIDEMERKIKKLSFLKQGMMQELLTGRIRLTGD